jgi:hypothetical protein
MSIYNEILEGEYWCPSPMVEGKKARRIAQDPTKHYPNKDESKELRKIMACTGLTEEEVRADKKYRKQLSDAQKEGQKAKSTELERFYKKLIKEACKTTGLAPQHPDTIAALDQIIKERSGRSWGRQWFFYQHMTTGKNIVKYYAKK